MTSCQTNPLEQFAAKSGSNNNGWFNGQIRRDLKSDSSNELNINRLHDKSRVENEFLNKNDGAYVIGKSSNRNGSFFASRSNKSANKEINTNSFVQEFSRINVQDHMEFSDSYKKLYYNYESLQPGFKSSLNTATNYRTGFSQNFGIQNNTAIYQLHKHNNYNMNKQNWEKTDVDYQFNEQFQELENELRTMADEQDKNLANVHYSEEQEFKDIATEITNTFSDQSSSLNNKGNLNSKIANSKFFDMMQGISQGEMSLEISKNAFVSTNTGETIGYEYSIIEDKINDQVHNT